MAQNPILKFSIYVFLQRKFPEMHFNSSYKILINTSIFAYIIGYCYILNIYPKYIAIFISFTVLTF